MFVVLRHCNEEECWGMLRRWNIKMPPAGSALYWMGKKSIMRKARSKQVMINVSLDLFANMFADWVCAACAYKHTNIRMDAYMYTHMNIGTHAQSNIVITLPTFMHTRTRSHKEIKGSHNNRHQEGVLCVGKRLCAQIALMSQICMLSTSLVSLFSS